MSKSAIIQDCQEALFQATGTRYKVYAVPDTEYVETFKCADPTSEKEQIIKNCLISTTESVFGLNQGELIENSRKRIRIYVNARNMINICLRERRWPLIAIGKVWGYDHSTVLRSVNMHQDWLKVDIEYKTLWDSLQIKLAECEFQ